MAADTKQGLSVGERFFASGAAVTGATVCTHPIDVVKVRLQLSTGQSARKDAFSVSRFLRFWPQLYGSHGLSAFYAGIGSASVRGATYGTARIGLCDPLQQTTGSRTGGALLAGVLATVVGNPFEVLKVRLQARPEEASRGEMKALRALVREEGLPALARGFHWAAARSAVLTASQVVPYSEAKAALQRSSSLEEGISLHVIASLAAGIVTCTATAPFDVIKTKVMSAARGRSESLSAMFRAEGAFVFFKGWVANYVRIGPQTVLIFVLFEQMQRLVFRLRS